MQPDPVPHSLSKVAGAELRKPIGNAEAFYRVREQNFLACLLPLWEDRVEQARGGLKYFI